MEVVAAANLSSISGDLVLLETKCQPAHQVLSIFGTVHGVKDSATYLLADTLMTVFKVRLAFVFQIGHFSKV